MASSGIKRHQAASSGINAQIRKSNTAFQPKQSTLDVSKLLRFWALFFQTNKHKFFFKALIFFDFPVNGVVGRSGRAKYGPKIGFYLRNADCPPVNGREGLYYDVQLMRVMGTSMGAGGKARIRYGDLPIWKDHS